MHQLAGALYQAADAVVIDKFPWGKAIHTEEPSTFWAKRFLSTSASWNSSTWIHLLPPISYVFPISSTC